MNSYIKIKSNQCHKPSCNGEITKKISQNHLFIEAD